jgi:hypothetical protein
MHPKMSDGLCRCSVDTVISRQSYWPGIARAAATTAILCDFFGLPPTPKKPRTPPREEGVCSTGTTGTGGMTFDLACAAMWGSRRTLSVSVNSSLLCSILSEKEGQTPIRWNSGRTADNSNSWSIQLSLASRHSGAVTKWILLLRVHVKAVGWVGKGTFTPRMPRTERCTINLENVHDVHARTFDENLTMRFSGFLLSPIFLDLMRILILEHEKSPSALDRWRLSPS